MRRLLGQLLQAEDSVHVELRRRRLEPVRRGQNFAGETRSKASWTSSRGSGHFLAECGHYRGQLDALGS